MNKPTLEPVASPTASAGNLEIVEAATRSPEDVLTRLCSTPEGINRIEAISRRGRVGANEVASERPPRWYIQLLHAFHSPFTYLLLTLAVISFVTEDLQATAIISLMVGLSGLLRFSQEYRSSQAVERLRSMVHTTATVARPQPNAQGGDGDGARPAGWDRVGSPRRSAHP
jgi:Mg2+-importing ATPase